MSDKRMRTLASRFARWAVASAALLAGVSAGALQGEAKAPGSTHCFNGVCHRVKTIAETRKLIGSKVVLSASHYDSCRNDRFNPCGLTSSGEEFHPDRPDNAASPIYPDGTKLLVWHPRTKRAAVVRINNAGPYYGKRTLDLSRAAADKLGFGRSGVTTVHAKVISAPSESEATYRRNRKYAPVPGFIGAFESIEHAFLDIGRAIGGLFVSPAHAAAGREPPRRLGGPAALTEASPSPKAPVLKSVAERRGLLPAQVPARKPQKAAIAVARKAG